MPSVFLDLAVVIKNDPFSISCMMHMTLLIFSPAFPSLPFYLDDSPNASHESTPS